jgi:hypothetical protein
MVYSLTGLSSLGTVTSEDSTKDAQLFQMPMPMADSTSAIMLDLFGVARTINIKGIFTGTTSEIETFIGQLDALVNGTQSNKTYHSDKSNANYIVLIQSARWTSEEGAPTKVDYDISMIEGTS